MRSSGFIWGFSILTSCLSLPEGHCMWVPISSHTYRSVCRCLCASVQAHLLFHHSVVSNSFATPWTVARQAPLSMGFSRQEHWVAIFLFEGIFPTQESNPCLLHWQVDSLPLSHQGSHIYASLIRPDRPPAKSVSELRTGGQIPHSGHPTLLLRGEAGGSLEGLLGEGRGSPVGTPGPWKARSRERTQ